MTQLYFEWEINTLERSCNRSREGREENENNNRSGLRKLVTLYSPQAKRISKHKNSVLRAECKKKRAKCILGGKKGNRVSENSGKVKNSNTES